MQPHFVGGAAIRCVSTCRWRWLIGRHAHLSDKCSPGAMRKWPTSSSSTSEPRLDRLPSLSWSLALLRFRFSAPNPAYGSAKYPRSRFRCCSISRSQQWQPPQSREANTRW